MLTLSIILSRKCLGVSHSFLWMSFGMTKHSRDYAELFLRTGVLPSLTSTNLLGTVTNRKSKSINKSGHKLVTDEIAELQRRIGELEFDVKIANLVRDLNGHMHVCRSFEDASTLMNLYLPQLFPDADGVVFLQDLETGMQKPVTAWGIDRPITEFETQQCFALRSHEEYQYRVGGDFDVCPPVDEKRSCCLYPIMDEDRPVGLLMIEPALDIPEETEEFSAVVERGRNVGNQLSFSISNLFVREKLRMASVRDPLTGLSNRRFLEESLEREEARSLRDQKPVAIVMVDIDHFKTFNDTNGHLAGDACLTKLGEVLRKFCRSGDIACRYGGEEFTLIFPGMNADIVNQRAEEIRAAIEETDCFYQGEKLPRVTASLGVAMFPIHGENIVETMSRADEALYQAKTDGRNRYCMADIPGGS